MGGRKSRVDFGRIQRSQICPDLRFVKIAECVFRRSEVCEVERRKRRKGGELCMRETVKSRIVARQPAEPRDRIGSMGASVSRAVDVLLSIRLRRF